MRAPSAGEEMFQGWGFSSSWSWESDLGYGETGDSSQAGTFPKGMLQKESFKNEHQENFSGLSVSVNAFQGVRAAHFLS